MLEKEVRENGSVRWKTVCEGPSMTEQSHREQVNINTIVARARKGILPVTTGLEPSYGDFSTGTDYLDARMAIKDAEDDFMRLPPEIRKRFGNSPAAMLDFLADPANLEEASELGLIATGREKEESHTTTPASEEVPAGTPTDLENESVGAAVQ